MQAQTRASSRGYWEDLLRAAQRAQDLESGLFKGCHTGMGAFLAEEHKKAILAYLNAPSQEQWLQIRGLSITAHHTLWQAWCAADPLAPRQGSRGYPSASALRDAIRQAVDQHLQTLRDKLQSLRKGHLQVV